MRFVLGIVTLAAGAATATLWLTPSPTDKLAMVSGVGAGNIARLEGPPVPGTPVRTLPSSSSNVDVTPAPASSGGRFFGFALPGSVTKPGPAPDVRLAAPEPARSAASWSTDVVVYPGGRTMEGESAAVPASRVTSAAPAPAPVARERPRYELARELQRELRRVGCYWGETDGEWGPGSRRGMRAFMDRVNSSLQSDEPDLIQLTLVRGYAGNACSNGGAPAAPGLVTAVRVPTPAPAPVPAARPSPVSREAAVVPTTTVAPGANPIVAGAVEGPSSGRPPLDGRMAVGGPVPDTRVLPPPLTAPPEHPGARTARPRPPAQAQAGPVVRRNPDRSWTAKFFDR